MIELSAMNDFVTWLNQEIEDRGWTYADVARQGGISKSMISRVVSGQNRPGPDFCKAVARAFRVPDEQVFRRAGLLDPLLPPVAEEQEAIRILRKLPASTRTTVMTMLRSLEEEGAK